MASDTTDLVTRRAFLHAGAAALAAAATASALAHAQVPPAAPNAMNTRLAPLGTAGGPTPNAMQTRLVLLGTAGGPTPKVGRAAPAQAIVVGDRVYLIDCGDGVARQLALAHLPMRQLRAVFITHHHSDHNAGYGPLFLLGWVAGLTTVDVYGPPPLVKMTRQLLDAYEFDITTRMADEGRAPLAPLIRPHEITSAGEVFKDDRVRVTAAMNHHPPITYSFAYRFDTPDRSIVISGDTNYSDSIVALAKNADVLVHEALYRPYWERPDSPQSAAVRQHIIASHTDAEDVGRIAAAAGVKQLVLSHFVPSDPPDAVTDDQWLAAAKKHYRGPVVIGRDLMELP